MFFKRFFQVVVTLFLVQSFANSVLAEETITFQLLRGRAALNRQGVGNWLDLGPEPLAIRVQDRLRTEGETRGEMKFPDGSIFRVKSNTILTLLDGGVQLQVGEAIFNLKKQGRNFQVVTPTAVCGVLGTSFDVNVDRFGKTQVRVFDGIVAVKTHGQERRQLVLQRGMMTAIQRQGAVDSKPQRFDPATVEGQMKKDWGGINPLKVGPDRPQLPQPRQPGKLIPPVPPTPQGQGWESLPQQLRQPQEGLPPLREGEKQRLQPGFEPRQSMPTPDSKAAPAGTGPRDQFNGLPPLRKSDFESSREGPGFRSTSPSSSALPQAGSNIRENMSFFETLQRQQNPNRQIGLPPGGTGNEARSNQSPEQADKSGFGYADPRFRQLNPGQMQEGHGRSFGQAGPGMLGAQDPQRLREELNLIQNQLSRNNEEVRQTETEINQVRQQLAQLAQQTLLRMQTTTNTTTSTGLPLPTPPTTTMTTSGVSPSQLQERLRALEERLRILRDQQQKLLIRLNDIRNRLN